MIGIGHATPIGATIHPAGCDCGICREHRALTALIETAESRHWIVNPAARQRLAQIKAEQQEAAHD